jgi:hypothetical protein
LDYVCEAAEPLNQPALCDPVTEILGWLDRQKRIPSGRRFHIPENFSEHPDFLAKTDSTTVSVTYILTLS